MPNVVKGSRQERMIVVPHRPGRSLVLALAIVFSALVMTLGGAYLGFTQGFDAQLDDQTTLSELDAMLEVVSSENEELRRRTALAERDAEVNQRAAQEVDSELNALQLLSLIHISEPTRPY